MNVDVALGVADGKVVAHWREAVSQIEFDPQNAYMIGMALCKAALEAGRGYQKKGDIEFVAGELAQAKVEVTDAQRDAMIGVVASIIKTFQDQHKTAGYIAMHCVDAVLKETAR